jgi:hypothetical protein
LSKFVSIDSIKIKDLNCKRSSRSDLFGISDGHNTKEIKRSKNKNRAGETERKKIRAPKKFEKKIRVETFNGENYKLK